MVERPTPAPKQEARHEHAGSLGAVRLGGTEHLERTLDGQTRRQGSELLDTEAMDAGSARTQLEAMTRPGNDVQLRPVDDLGPDSTR